MVPHIYSPLCSGCREAVAAACPFLLALGFQQLAACKDCVFTLFIKRCSSPTQIPHTQVPNPRAVTFFFVKTCIYILINRRIYKQKRKKKHRTISVLQSLYKDTKSLSCVCMCITGCVTNPWFCFKNEKLQSRFQCYRKRFQQ